MFTYLHKVRRHLQVRFAKKIIFGAGSTSFPGWLSINKWDIDVTKREHFLHFWKSGSREAFLSEHVWEHLTDKEIEIANANCFDFIKKKGRLRLAVPDGYFPDSEYIEHVRPGGSGPGAKDHKILFNYALLKKKLEYTGFDVTLLEY